MVWERLGDRVVVEKRKKRKVEEVERRGGGEFPGRLDLCMDKVRVCSSVLSLFRARALLVVGLSGGCVFFKSCLGYSGAGKEARFIQRVEGLMCVCGRDRTDTNRETGKMNATRRSGESRNANAENEERREKKETMGGECFFGDEGWDGMG